MSQCSHFWPRRLALLALVSSATPILMLTGCATAPPLAAPQVSASGQWSGRLSLNVDTVPPEQFYAAFELSGSAEAGTLALNTPLGNTIALLRWSPSQATLEQSGQTHDYPSLTELAAAVTGTPIPIRSLFSWLQGNDAPVPGWSADLSRLGQGRINATRHHPAPSAQLRIILQNDAG